MKKLSILVFALFAYFNSFAQCDQLFDFKEGTSWTWSEYNKKGKLLSKTIQKVESLTIDGSDRDIVLSVTRAEANGDQMEPISMEMSCRDGVIIFDMKKFLPVNYLSSEEGELKVESENLEMPSSMSVGDKLKDASIKMVSGESPVSINISANITDRKVVAEETLNTPAGEFNCVVLEQTISTKIMMSFVMQSKEWYTPGVGMIKSESYKNGKMVGYSMLTAFSR